VSNAAFVRPNVSAILPTMMGGNGQFFPVIASSLPTRGTNTSIDRQVNLLKNGSSSIFHGLVSSVVSALSDVGMALHPDDVARIKDTIKKMEKYEDQLIKMSIALNQFVKLARAFGISLENIDKNNYRVIDFKNIRNYEDITEFVRKYAKDIHKNMNSNMTIQQATTFEFMNKIVPRYLDECVDKLGGPSGAPCSNNVVRDVVPL